MVTDDVFAVIAEATRRDILVSLRKGDKAVGELVQELEASQPTISKHLKILREAHLVSMRAEGQKRYYALNPEPLAGVAKWLKTFDVGTAGIAGAPEPAAGRAAETGGKAALGGRDEAGLDAHHQAPSSPLPAASPGARPAAAAALAGQPAGRAAGGPLSPAVVAPGGPVSEDRMPQQLGRSVGRAATKAADLLANLPKFGRKK